MKSDFLIAVTQLAAERNLPREVVLEAVEAALVSAYKKDSLAPGYEINVKVIPNTGEVRVYAQKVVVENPTDPHKETSLADAQKIKRTVTLGETVDIEINVSPSAGRIAAQTAKQVVLQRLREAERELIFNEFHKKEGDILSGVIQRVDPRQVTVDLGRAEAILPPAEQVPLERYRPGQRLKVFVLEVQRSARGPQILVSRTHKGLLRRLFELEVPEVFSGVVEIKAIAREPGHRAKVAVVARQEGVDAVGSCVGLRGIRIQNIVNELNGEKVDVIQWHPDTAGLIANALSPAQVVRVNIDAKENTAQVVVPDRQLSLAIGREGQNARLVAKLTGWRIDIKSAAEAEAERARKAAAAAEQAAQGQPVVEPVPVPAVAVEAAKVEVAPLAPQVKPELVPALAQAQPVEAAAREGPEAPAPALPVERALSEEEIWRMPVAAAAAPERPQIRFAEEVLSPQGLKPKEKKGKGKKAPEEETVKARKGKRIRWGEEEEDLGDLSG